MPSLAVRAQGGRGAPSGRSRTLSLEVEYIRSPKFLRKEDRIAEVLAERGNHPGLVHIFSVMETCSTFAPWHDKKTGKTSLRRDSGKCIHYYFFFLDPELGLCYVRVPTWAPIRLQVYFNGHHWLAHRLEERGSQFSSPSPTTPS